MAREENVGVPEQIEVYADTRLGYHHLMAYDTWLVAICNAAPEDLPEKIPELRKHEMTDEVFVLLGGECILLSGGQGERIGQIVGVRMELGKAYNVKKGTWHGHILEPGTRLVIVENAPEGNRINHSEDLTDEQRAHIARLCRDLRSE